MVRVINPANGSLVREYPQDTPRSISEKFSRAWNAQKAWRETPLRERMEIVLGFRNRLVDRREDLAHTLTTEMGKPIRQSRNELKGVLARIDYFLEHVGQVLEDETVAEDPAGGMRERITQEPLGVIANISAWNYPYFVGTNVFVPALLTGNAVLYKPSEHATMTGLAIESAFRESGLPEGLFTAVVGNGSVGAELLHQKLDGVYFTGSYGTGKRIAESVAGRLIRVQLELGGKDPAYVCDDADARAAAASLADGAFYNAGQSCCSVERIYVQERIYDAFVDAFLREVSSFKIGDPLEDSTDLGPLAREAQLALLEDQVKDALARGAKLAHGGKRGAGSGFYFEPTVLLEADHSMKLMREESFGPIIGIQKVADDEEALACMRDTPYGLTAGVYTPNQDRAERILEQLPVGSAYWNCCDRVSPRLPWSGRGHSGIGSTLSKAGILGFVQPKAWHFKSARSR